MKIHFTFLTLLLSTLFSYAQPWVQVAPIPVADPVNGVFSFSINGKLYVGGGLNSSGPQNGFYEYDPATNAWTTKANVPDGIDGNYGFVINGKGYIVGGYDGNLINSVYMYDPAANVWSAKNAFPGGARENHICFSLNEHGYLFGGFIGGSTVVNDMWQYDTLTDTWTQMASAPGPGRNNPTFLVINGQIFVGLGGTVSGPPYYSDFYLFNPDSNTYTIKESLPVTKSCAANFTLGNLGYVGLGVTGGGSYANDFYTYNPASNTWSQVGNFGGAARAHMFNEVVAGKPYIGCGDTATGLNTSDVWSYPYALGIQDLNSTPKLSCYPSPASGSFSIDMSSFEAGEKQVDIRSEIGQVVYQAPASESTILVGKDLSPGLYIVTVTQGSHRENAKVVVE